MKHLKLSDTVDESTDKGCMKHLFMVPRMFIDDQVKGLFWRLILPKDRSALSLYNSLVKFFTHNDIPYKENMIGFGADGGNAMLGSHNSFSSHLKNDVNVSCPSWERVNI